MVSCTECEILAIIAGKLRNEASAKVAEYFLSRTLLPYRIVHLPGSGGKVYSDYVLLTKSEDEPIDSKGILPLVQSCGAILISAPTYYEPEHHAELAFWEKILLSAGKEYLKGKLGLALAIGGTHPKQALRAIVKFFEQCKIRTYIAIANNGIEDCFECEIGENCYLSDALKTFKRDSSIVQDLIATAHFEREDIPDCCPGKVLLMPTIEEIARSFGSKFRASPTTP